MSTTASNGLLTDFYELTMAAAYFDHHMDERATFSLFLRPHALRSYYVAAGLTSAMAYLKDWHFKADDIEYLRQSGRFTAPFLDYLHRLRFEGDVWAMPEGTLFFPDEPVLEVTAPLVQAQLVETFLINAVGLHTLLATKAARCVYTAQGRRLIEFGLRRTQGEIAGMAAARSAYLAGFDATSNVLASKQYGIPLVGTMAHSFVQAFDNEMEAFLAYVQTFPDSAVLLIDTYDTIAGAHNAAAVARKMQAQGGHRLVGVRLDSGDRVALSRQVRTILDEAGLLQVKIYASGGFDEFSVGQAVACNAPIDAFGVGTRVGVSADLPYLDMVYKMVRYDDRNVLKRSPGKETIAGEKQIFRYRNGYGVFAKDIIGMRRELRDDAQPLLHLVMQDGKVCQPLPSVHRAREHFKTEFACLPEDYKILADPPIYPVRISSALQADQAAAVPERRNQEVMIQN